MKSIIQLIRTHRATILGVAVTFGFLFFVACQSAPQSQNQNLPQASEQISVGTPIEVHTGPIIDMDGASWSQVDGSDVKVVFDDATGEYKVVGADGKNINGAGAKQPIFVLGTGAHVGNIITITGTGDSATDSSQAGEAGGGSQSTDQKQDGTLDVDASGTSL